MASDPHGVNRINKFGQDHFEGKLQCSWTDAKGRIVHATRAFELGEIIFREAPLHIAQEGKSGRQLGEDDNLISPPGKEEHPAWKKLKKLCKTYEDDFDYDPLWYWCALCSLTKEHLDGAEGQKAKAKPSTMPAGRWEPVDSEIHQNLLLLHHEDVTEESSAAKILKRELCPNADPIVLERLIQIWVLNCFEYSDAPQGYSTYFFSSFMSHSCFPNAVWHYDGSDHVLRARRAIDVGDEVCISYLPEDGLLQTAPSRRWELHETKRFWCTCERCKAGELDLSRGLTCPKCGEGKVFAKVPKGGPQKNADLLKDHLVDAECTKCQQKLTKAESEACHKEEVRLKGIVDTLTDGDRDDLSPARCEEIEAMINEKFAQHVLADLAWEQLADHYASTRRRGQQRRLMDLRRAFHREAYPGLSGAHAWTLEAFGDAMIIDSASQASRKGGGKSEWQEVVKPDFKKAGEYYTEALDILTKMFGEEHEYVTQVEEKREKLPKE